MRTDPSDMTRGLITRLVILTIALAIVTVSGSRFFNSIADDFSVTSTKIKTIHVIQVEKNQSIFGTSVAYIVDNPEGSGRISVKETNTYARYKAGDKIRLKITDYKNSETKIDLKN